MPETTALTDVGVARGVRAFGKTTGRRARALPSRVWRQVYLCLLLSRSVRGQRLGRLPSPNWTFLSTREATLRYVAANERPEAGAGVYTYRIGGQPLLYASCYASLTRHLYGDLEAVLPGERAKWAQYIQGFQGDDGLFRDPAVAGDLAEELDWWGWRHLTLHCLMALTALDSVAAKPLGPIERFRKPGSVADWLSSRNWKGDAPGASNEVQNHATFLQYARDYHGALWCADALDELFGWLDLHQDSGTGLWRNSFRSPEQRSDGVQTGYHLWLLYFYDQRPLHHVERIVDSCLATQNRLGGFGVPLNSSACEDIDSIDPLSRLYHLTEYRRADIRKALCRALSWVLVNRNADGGYVFRRNEAFQYGHPLMTTASDESSMFATWFRTLSLAYIEELLSQLPSTASQWRFIKGPGHQFQVGQSRPG